MKYFKGNFKSTCLECYTENIEVYFSETDENSDSAICLECLKSYQNQADPAHGENAIEII